MRFDSVAECGRSIATNRSPCWRGEFVGATLDPHPCCAPGGGHLLRLCQTFGLKSSPPRGHGLIVIAATSCDPLRAPVFVLIDHYRMQQTHLDAIQSLGGAHDPVVISAKFSEAVRR